MTVFRKFLILVHRYLGIPLSFMFVLWFISGIVMMYAGGMPQLTARSRLEHLPALDLTRITIAPLAAAELAGADPAAGEALLLPVLDRPAYRFGGPPFGATTVFADTGEILEEVDVERATRIAARFVDVPKEAVHYVRTLDQVDQWTLVMRRALPLYKFTIDDAAATQVYVSPALAEVSLVTTRGTRALAWAGTIPHWLYFTPLRINQPLWYWTVVWASGLGCVLAIIGLVLGVTQFHKSKPFSVAKSIRYRGWVRWHYISGVLFGVFALTWVFSGLLSMEPFAWTSAEGLNVQRAVFSGEPVGLTRFPPIDSARLSGLLEGRTLKEVEFTSIQEAPYYLARYTENAPELRRERLHQPYPIAGRAQPDQLLLAADSLKERTEPFNAESLLTRLRAATPDAAIVESELLTDYDAYYYSRGRQAPLPILRVKFDDPRRTWVYVDPQMSEIVAEIHNLNRVERWLYNGLHSLDFSFWYDRRPLWDIGMIVLSLGALATSLIGLFLGIKRARRDVTRLVTRP